MSNLKIYSKAFSESLGISESLCNDKLEYNGVEEWDSIGHMTLIAALEEKFKISIDTDDIVDFSSYKKGREILQKYKVEF